MAPLLIVSFSESRRIQALKENNMEAYIALVQETKNTRLKYLLAQTDEYIATIRNMIRDQREVTPSHPAPCPVTGGRMQTLRQSSREWARR
jgi:hypothetical protein